MKYFDRIIINRILIIVLLLGAVMSTSANMTLPLPNIHEHPSSALYKANSNLIVQKENLIIVCNYAWCDVTALYYIKAQKTEQEFAFEFILPDKVEVSVHIGTKEVSVQTVSSDPMDDREKNALLLSPTKWSHIVPKQLFKASFKGILHHGINMIQVKYSQPLSKYVTKYQTHYFNRTQFVKYFQYELWPLKTWTLSKNFNMELSIKMARKKPNWWKQIFGTLHTVSCHVFAFNQETSIIQKKPFQQDEYLVLTISFDQHFPQRIFCLMGPENEISGFHSQLAKEGE